MPATGAGATGAGDGCRRDGRGPAPRARRRRRAPGSGVAFRTGQEWVVGSAQERDALVSAAGWARVDALLAPVPGGSALPRLRDAVGLGSTVPTPDRVFVGGGGYADASAYAGAGGAGATGTTGEAASGAQDGSALLGASWSPDSPDDRTLYYRTTAPASTLAALGGSGPSAADPDATSTTSTLTTLTLRDGEVVRASRSGIDAGVQYDAVLDVATGDDLQAVAALASSSAIDLAAAGVTDAAPARRASPTTSLFAAAVRDRGELTRVEVAPAEGSPSTLVYDRPQVFDGRGYAPRPTC